MGLLELIKLPWKAAIGIATWIKDLAVLPGRVKAIENATKAQTDPRPGCTACGQGRVSVTKVQPTEMGFPFTIGACDNCGSRWSMSPNGEKLNRLAYPSE